MRILVCGTRTYSDREAIKKAIIEYGADEVIAGEATGADSLALDIARELDIGWNCYYADWDLFDKAAGPIRNKRMLDEGKPDMVLAFFAGRRTRGTNNMVSQAKAAGVRVVEYGL